MLSSAGLVCSHHSSIDYELRAMFDKVKQGGCGAAVFLLLHCQRDLQPSETKKVLSAVGYTGRCRLISFNYSSLSNIFLGKVALLSEMTLFYQVSTPRAICHMT